MADAPIAKNANEARSQAMRRLWRDMPPEMKEARLRALAEAQHKRWESMAQEERDLLQARMAEGRAKSETRVPNMARALYRKAGVPEEEIEYLLSLPQRERKWARKREVLYGVRPSEVALIRERQNGLCPLCDKELTGRVHLDHDHGTGAVRGLLCAGCNLALGHIEARPPEWFVRVTRYVTTAGREAA